MSYIAKNIRYLRKKRHLSQSELGKRLERAESTIQMWETDLRTPTMETVRKLSDIFSIDINSLVSTDLSVDNHGMVDDKGIQRINMDYFIKRLILSGDTLNNFFEYYFSEFMSSTGWDGYSDYSFATIDQLKAHYADLYYGRKIFTYEEQREFNRVSRMSTYDFDDKFSDFTVKEILSFLDNPRENPLTTSRSNDLDYDIEQSLIEAERSIKLYQLRGDILEDDANEYLKKIEIIYDHFIPYLEPDFNSEIKENFSIYKSAKNTNKTQKNMIPVLGIVPCGEPIEAIEEVIEWIEVVPSQAKGHFGLIAKGDSMSPYILDGDILIVKYTPEVNSGKIAIVKVNGDEATCKRLMINDAGITLMPYNPAYEPLSFTPQEVEEKPVMIIGEVVEIRRRFNQK